MRLFVVLSFVSMFFCSCDCFMNVGGVVYDKTSGNPIDSVEYNVYEDNRYLYTFHTDSLGRYAWGFKGNPCPAISIVFEKKGYVANSVLFMKGEDDDINVVLHRN